jgi:hypothetical protein
MLRWRSLIPASRAGEATLAKVSDDAQKRAEASFKKKELQAREGAKARQEYEAAGDAMREKTARLRELRLARDAAEAAMPKATPAVKKKKAAKKGQAKPGTLSDWLDNQKGSGRRS